MSVTNRSLIALALAMWLAPPAHAEDVKVRVVGEPDAQPAPAEPQADRESQSPANADADADTSFPRTGDHQLDYLLRERLELTDRQAAAVRPLLEAYRAQVKASREAVRDEVTDLYKQMGEARRAGDTDKVRELMRRSRDASKARRERLAQGRSELLTRLGELLTPEQAEDLTRLREELEGTPMGRARQMARSLLYVATRGVTDLTAAQRRRMIDAITLRILPAMKERAALAEKIAPLQAAATEAYVNKETDKAKALRQQIRELYNQANADAPAYARIAREEADKVLTADQRTARDRQQRAYQAKVASSWIRWATYRAEKVRDLTPAQQEKIRQLKSAAHNVLVTLETRDYKSRRELTEQLRKDVEAVLTDQQQKQLQEQARSPYARRGDRNTDGQ
jgi:hypothetical protein